jgi:RimJ/RimL family protein N-acetyltransferase
MRAMISWGKKVLKVEKINLKVFLDNKHAVDFYKRCGFARVKKIPLVKVIMPDEEKWEIASGQNAVNAQRYYLEMTYV